MFSSVPLMDVIRYLQYAHLQDQPLSRDLNYLCLIAQSSTHEVYINLEEAL